MNYETDSRRLYLTAEQDPNSVTLAQVVTVEDVELSRQAQEINGLELSMFNILIYSAFALPWLHLRGYSFYLETDSCTSWEAERVGSLETWKSLCQRYEHIYDENLDKIVLYIMSDQAPEIDAFCNQSKNQTGNIRIPEKREIGTINGLPVSYNFVVSPLLNSDPTLSDLGYPDKKRMIPSGTFQIFWAGYENNQRPWGMIEWNYIDIDLKEWIGCADLFEELYKSYPIFIEAPLVAIRITGNIPERFKGKGLGKLMYRIIIQEFWNELQKPFMMTTDLCFGGSTSPSAVNVWTSLALRNQGKWNAVYDPNDFRRTILAIDKNPELVDLDCLRSKGMSTEPFESFRVNRKVKKKA